MDGPICLHICHGRIIARCLCSCLSLANLHLPSSVCGLPTFVRRKRCLHNLYLLVIIQFFIEFAVWLKLKSSAIETPYVQQQQNHCCGLSTFAWKCRLSTEYLSAGHVSAIIGFAIISNMLSNQNYSYF